MNYESYRDEIVNVDSQNENFFVKLNKVRKIIDRANVDKDINHADWIKLYHLRKELGY